jgi:hypothetical protein
MDKLSILDELERLLREGNRQSGQRSYGRRAPSPESLPALAKARAGLRAYTKDHPEDSRGWRLLSSAEEMLLAYSLALAALERSMELSGRKDKADLKRLGLLRGAIRESNKLGLSPQQLADLGQYLKEKLSTTGDADDLGHTTAWLADRGFSEEQAERILEALRARGAHSDDQVVDKIVESH